MEKLEISTTKNSINTFLMKRTKFRGYGKVLSLIFILLFINFTLSAQKWVANICVYGTTTSCNSGDGGFPVTAPIGDCNHGYTITSNVTNNYSFSITVIWNRKVIPTPVVQPPIASCPSSISLTADSQFSTNFQWEVAENPTSGNWVPFGVNSYSVTASDQELFKSGFTSKHNSPRYFRVTDPNCVGVVSPPIGPYFFYAPPPVVSVINGSSPTCPSGNDGSISIQHSSITAGQSYIYSIAQLLPASNGGCLSQPELPSPPNGYCYGAKSNAINATGASVFNITNDNLLDQSLRFFPGRYLIKIEGVDGGGPSCYTTMEVDINPPPAFGVTPGTVTPPSCQGGNNGSVSIDLVNGKNDYTWSLIGPVNVANTVTAGDFTINNLKEGNYTLTVTDNCNVSVVTNSLTISQSGVVFNLTAPTELQEVDPTCNANGSFPVSVNQVGGLSTGYSYKLSNNDDNTHTAIANAGSSVTGLSTTFTNLSDVLTYRVEATSPQGCVDVETVKLEPPPNLAGSWTHTDNTCFGASEGTLVFTRNEDAGSTNLTFTLNGAPATPTVTDNQYTLAGLTSDIYDVAVTDNCLTSTGASVKSVALNDVSIDDPANSLTINTGGAYVADNQTFALACYDQLQTVQTSFQYGKPPYIVTLERNGVLQANTDHISPVTFSSLTLGNYKISVTDACGVSESIDFTIQSVATSILTVATTQPLHPNNLNLTCPESNDGRISVLVSGGVRSGADADAYHVYLLSASDVVLVDNDGGTATTSSNTYGSVAPGVGEA
ncbi:MAG: hypothetical protein EBR30_15970, partial [Cytophagia bacterium]|nr:hypothetical protein [Cytophagia bacterium]